MSDRFNKPLTPTRRRRKTYQSEDQILAMIDRKLRLEKKKAKLSEDLFKEQKLLFRKAGDFLTEYEQTPVEEDEVRKLLWHEYKSAEGQANGAKKKSERMGSEASRIRTEVIPRLKQLLSAFRTQTMPVVMGEYRGVALP